MVERAGGACLLLEAAQAIGVFRDRGGQDLDRHLAPQAGVAGTIDDPHTPRADACQDLIRPE